LSDLELGMRHHEHRSIRGRHGRGCVAVLIALTVVVAAIGVVVWRGTDLVSGWFADPEDYSGQGTGSVRIEVLEGDSATDIGTTLEKAGVVASVEAFTDAAEGDPRSVSIQPGVYRLHEQMSAQAALSLLVGGEAVIDDSVTVPEGYTVQETIDRLVEDGGLNRADLERAVGSPDRLNLPGWARGDVEGFLYPSTNRADSRTTAADVLAEMVAQFSQQANQLSLVDKAQAQGVSPRDIVIIASLVQAEVNRPQDFGKVVQVIHNRLDIGMPLQFDSTRDYADDLARADVFTNPWQRRNPSRYDTYKHEGLPPGAIDSPGERALRAALNPTPGKWRYFVTVDLETGRTLFAKTFKQHKRNVALYRDYCDDSDLC